MLNRKPVQTNTTEKHNELHNTSIVKLTMARWDADRQTLLSPISELVFSDPPITNITKLLKQLITTNNHTYTSSLERKINQNYI